MARRPLAYLCHLVTQSPGHLVALFGLLTATTAHAGPQPPPIPPPPPAPLVGVRIIGPVGSQATFFPEPGRMQGFPVPAVASVRPGYLYRFRLNNLPQGKDVA